MSNPLTPPRTTTRTPEGNTRPYGIHNGGNPTDRIAAHMYCQYEWTEETTNSNTPTTTQPTIVPVTAESALIPERPMQYTRVHCSNVAIITPGYYRSCAQHILHTLRDSLLAYLQRPSLPLEQLPPETRNTYDANTQRVTATMQQLDRMLAPTAPSVPAPSAPKPRTPRAKKGTQPTP
jgi:hypothetical protein